MKANRRRDTGPERELRSLLHGRGYRFRIDRPVKLADRTARPDILFSRQRLAVYVDGCFWHSCPTHGTQPKANSAFWRAKLAANVVRDRRINEALETAGWRVLRVWEHTPVPLAAELVVRALGEYHSPSKGTGTFLRSGRVTLRH